MRLASAGIKTTLRQEPLHFYFETGGLPPDRAEKLTAYAGKPMETEKGDGSPSEP